MDVIGALDSALSYSGASDICLIGLCNASFDLNILSAWAVVSIVPLALRAMIHWSNSPPVETGERRLQFLGHSEKPLHWHSEGGDASCFIATPNPQCF